MRIKKYAKPRTIRFKKDLDREVADYSVKHEIGISDIVNNAVECYIRNPKCKARRRK